METDEEPAVVHDPMMESLDHDDDDDDVVVDDAMMMHHDDDDDVHDNIVMDFLDRPPTREDLFEVCSYEGIAHFWY
jgi:hypothetical protein